MRDYLLMLFITAAVTHILTGPVRKFAINIGVVPEVRARDVHREPTPRLGGMAMFGGLLAGLLVASHLPHLEEIFTESSTPRALLSGAALICLLGVLDDKWGVDALVKLGGQVLAAGVMVFQGLTILWLPVPGTDGIYLSDWQGTLLTVGLIVVSINAVNFVDGLDGLASRHGGHRGVGVLPVRVPALVRLRDRGRRVHHADLGDPGGDVPGLPGPQLPPGPDLHG